MRRPIITDERFIAAVRGEQYAVLAPPREVLEAYDEVQLAIRTRLSGLDVVYPRAHLTLASFARGTEPREAQAAVDRWSRRASPLLLRLDGLGTFGPPHGVLFAAVAKTLELGRAYATLRRESRSRGLAAVGGEGGDIQPERWRPHLTLAYCGRLDAEGWERAAEAVREGHLPARAGTSAEVELVSYDAEGERLIASFPLRGGGRR